MTQWKSLLKDGKPREDAAYEWRDPATADEIAQVERTLNLKLPPDLRDFLLQSNGVGNDMGDELVMSTAEIGENQQETQSIYADWEDADASRLLMFGNWLGNGDLYAYVIQPEEGEELHDIVVFDHETGEARPLAKNLAALLQMQSDGKL